MDMKAPLIILIVFCCIGINLQLVAAQQVIEEQDVPTEDIKTKTATDTEDENVIMVMASRREEALQDVGMAITAIYPEQFDSVGLSLIEDIIAYTPGINFNSFGSEGVGSISIRGAAQRGGSAVVGTYVDDVPITSNSPVAYADIIPFDGTLGDIEHIEIIKGPQGTLYGANTVGGVIRYITKDPSTDEVYGELSVDYSNTEQGSWNQQYRGNISVPLINDKLGLTITGFTSNQEGFIDELASASGSYKKNINGMERDGLSASLLWNISETTTMKINTLQTKAEFHGFSDINLDYPSLEPTYAPYLIDFGYSDDIYKNEFESFSMALDLDFGWATLSSVTARVNFNFDLNSDATLDLGAFADFLTGSPEGTNTVPFTQHAQSEKIIQEFRLTSVNNDQLEWLIGFYFTDEDTELFQSLIAIPNDFNFSNSNFPSKFKEKALFGNITWYYDEDFDINFGLRFSDNQLGINSDVSGLFNTGQFGDEHLILDGNIDDEVLTYSLGARWRLGSEVSLYSRIASSYRPAFGNIPLWDLATGDNVAPLVVNADNLVSYEIGVKGNALENKLRYDVAVWAIDWDDFQINIFFDGFRSFGNADSGIAAKGFEAEIDYRPVDAVKLYASLAFNDSSLRGDEPELGGVKGDAVPNLAKWTASLMANYEFTIFGFDTSVGAGMRYTGDTYSAFNDSSLDNFKIKTPGYALADLNANIRNGQYSLTLYMTNAFDKYGYSYTNGFEGFSGPAANGGVFQPRTTGIIFEMDF
ncbi:MAG: iron complex outermembrane receptor protein [Enterobacterales bacterium]|jgi:iron complex outermembrane receptor protein